MMCHMLEWLPLVYALWLLCHKSDAMFEGNCILCRQIRRAPDPVPIMHQYINLHD